MKKIIIFCLLYFFFSSIAERGCVIYDNNNFNVLIDCPVETTKNVVAYGSYENKMTSDGWNHLKIHTKKNDFLDKISSFGMGVFEGYFSSREIFYALKIVKDGTFPSGIPPELTNFIKQTDYYIMDQIIKNKNDTYWEMIEIGISQMKGILYGLNLNGNYGKFTLEDVYILNLSGDLEGIIPSLKINSINGISKALRDTQIKGPLDHCSGLIKMLEDYSDVYVAHTTWSSLNSMIRVLKMYDYNFNSKPSYKITFSSYPALLSSGDDWYTLKEHLSIIETTLVVWDDSLWKHVKPYGQMPSFIRILTCNTLSNRGSEWANCMKLYSSGSYPNEYFILDYDFLKPTIQNHDLLWFYAEIPSVQKYYDITNRLLNEKYVPTYNIATDKDIYRICNYDDLVKKYGDWFTYEKHPRGLIFQRDQKNITNIEGMKKIMRYNKYQSDPISQLNPGNSIASRKDLIKKDTPIPNPFLKGSCFGGTDSKVGSYELTKKYQVTCELGPTHDNQPVFSWSKSELCNSTIHYGHVDSYDFSWIIFGA